jgi:hypothetical protein
MGTLLQWKTMGLMSTGRVDLLQRSMMNKQKDNIQKNSSQRRRRRRN